jgi:riboflavin kinase/FMN adenylyltransferase
VRSFEVYRGVPVPGQRLACALAIGNFDGVHQGHRALLQQVVHAASQRQLVPAAMTFEPHPREFLAAATAPARISSLRDKIAGLRDCGIRRVFVMPFRHTLASLDAQRFIDDILVAGCQARWIMVGDDFHFGARRTGNLALLQANASRGGFEVNSLGAVLHHGQRISSSLVRSALGNGQLDLARQLLGQPYHMSGHVIHGAKLGRQIGFPTINMPLGHRRHPAVHGIFAVRVHGLGPVRNGVASAGFRPTVDQAGRWLLETHLFDFNQDVYGHLVDIEFVHKLRDEEKFDSIDTMTRAIRNDARQARDLLSSLPLTGTAC